MGKKIGTRGRSVGVTVTVGVGEFVGVTVGVGVFVMRGVGVYVPPVQSGE